MQNVSIKYKYVHWNITLEAVVMLIEERSDDVSLSIKPSAAGVLDVHSVWHKMMIG